MFKSIAKFMSLGALLAMSSCAQAAVNDSKPTMLTKVYEITSTKLPDGIYQVSLSLCSDGVTPSQNEKKEWIYSGSGTVVKLALYSRSETLDDGTYQPVSVDIDEKTMAPKGYKLGTFATGREYKLFGLFPIPVFTHVVPIDNGKAQSAKYITDGTISVKKTGNDYVINIVSGQGTYHFKGTIDSKQIAATSTHYYDKTKKEKPLETKYAALGSEKVAYAEFPAANATIGKFEIWYPKSLELSSKRYPVVLYANGTGNAASKEADFLQHLASWGFIVVGNEDPNTRTGASMQAGLEKVLALNVDAKSVLYNKVDTKNIGIAGHSQGGVAVYNAVAAQPGGKYYKAIYAASATSPYWGQKGVFGPEWSYNITKVKAPVFMIAGTGMFDAGTAKDITPHEGQGITPLWSLEANYNALPATTKKIYARKTGIDHGESLYEFDGYMTAWFRWLLCGDTEAAKAFVGNDGEIKHNSLYQDVKANF